MFDRERYGDVHPTLEPLIEAYEAEARREPELEKAILRAANEYNDHVRKQTEGRQAIEAVAKVFGVEIPDALPPLPGAPVPVPADPDGVADALVGKVAEAVKDEAEEKPRTRGMHGKTKEQRRKIFRQWLYDHKGRTFTNVELQEWMNIGRQGAAELIRYGLDRNWIKEDRSRRSLGRKHGRFSMAYVYNDERLPTPPNTSPGPVEAVRSAKVPRGKAVNLNPVPGAVEGKVRAVLAPLARRGAKFDVTKNSHVRITLDGKSIITSGHDHAIEKVKKDVREAFGTN